MSAAVIIVAAGRGRRMGAAGNKVLLPLAGVPILAHAISAFNRHMDVVQVIVVTRDVDIPAVEAIIDKLEMKDSCQLVIGGATRAASVVNGLALVDARCDYVLVHDGARPLVSAAVIDRVIGALKTARAVIPIMPVVNTIKRAKGGRVVETLARAELVAVQTPQGFHYSTIQDMYRRAVSMSNVITDDASLAEAIDIPVYCVDGEDYNIKITTPRDLALATVMLNDCEDD